MSRHDDVLKTETILIDDAYFMSLLGDINAARHTIDFEVYIFSDDPAGIILSNALCDAANRGVKVRVLVDGIGTPDWGNELTVKMQKAGIATRVYHPLPWIVRHWQLGTHAPNFLVKKFIDLLSKINTRNHRKSCIIDHDIIYIGSANITTHLVSNINRDNIWRETSVKMTGYQTDTLQYAFEGAWGYFPLKKRIRSFFHKVSVEPVVRLNYFRRLRRALYKSLLSKISNCKKVIWITNAYFVPDNRLLKKLKNASKKGVDVRILLPLSSDVLIESLASKTFYINLLNSGISIYEYLPNILHAKSLILDDWYLVGSSNLNFRSIRHDLEVDLNIQSKTAKEMLEKQFLVDLKNSRKLSVDDVSKQPFYEYFMGRIILIFKYWI
jgi:cardiolipin synthase